MTDLADIDAQIADVKARRDRELVDLYRLRAKIEPPAETALLADWLTISEVARIEGTSKGAIRQRLYRAQAAGVDIAKTMKGAFRAFEASDLQKAGVVTRVT